MLEITTNEEVRTAEGMAVVLERVLELIRGGYTSGFEPSWQLTGDEEPLQRCVECGGPMFVEDSGVSHHGEPDSIDHDADADHVAVADEDYEL